MDIVRTRRDRDHHELAYRREVCGNFLGAISLATHRLYDLWGNGPNEQNERNREAGRILTESAGYLERQQLLMIAPGLESKTNDLFETLRELRTIVAANQPYSEEDWANAVSRLTAAMDALRSAMLNDLSKTFRYVTSTTLTNRRAPATPAT